MPGTDTRTEILDAAQQLIQTHGANGMSYKHISEAVGIRKASIHYHFPTKGDLIAKLVERYSRGFLERVHHIRTVRSSAPDKLRRYFALFEATLRDPEGKLCLCGMLSAELASLEEPAIAQLRLFFRENARRLAAILEEGRSEGSLEFEGSAGDAANLLFALLEGALLTSRTDGGVRRFRAITGQFLKLVGA